jgi:hypothetical protein
VLFGKASWPDIESKHPISLAQIGTLSLYTYFSECKGLNLNIFHTICLQQEFSSSLADVIFVVEKSIRNNVVALV